MSRLSAVWLDGRRINRNDARKTVEIANIEGQHVLNSMNYIAATR
jgi:hypothetical protein